jgi:hypothetical protein
LVLSYFLTKITTIALNIIRRKDEESFFKNEQDEQAYLGFGFNKKYEALYTWAITPSTNKP